MIVEDFLRYMLAERDASPQTVETYREALDDYKAFLEKLDSQLTPEGADSDVIRDWIEDMMEKGQKASYACKKLSAVKSLYRYALRKGIVERDPAHKVTGPKKEKVLPTFLREEEADNLFDKLDWNLEDIKDVRARTLLLLLYSTGIRRAELVALRDEDVNLINREIKVTGKRRKQRIVPLGEEMVEAIKYYQQLRDEKNPATDDSHALFRNDKGEAVTAAIVYNIVRRYLSFVTTQKKRSPHVLRHTFATVMLNHDAKLGSVQKLLGHESLKTTQIYTHVTFEELKRSYEDAHPREGKNSQL
ncbi:MAG: tyrosine-type recombinase/integrase [Prevotella sp.]|nr:tyrosine-type recombinase/integrase [Prevotella sp.]